MALCVNECMSLMDPLSASSPRRLLVSAFTVLVCVVVLPVGVTAVLLNLVTPSRHL